MIFELHNPFPCRVISKDNREATVMFLLDYGQEHGTLFGCFMRDTGEFWWVPQTDVRLFSNWSMYHEDTSVTKKQMFYGPDGKTDKNPEPVESFSLREHCGRPDANQWRDIAERMEKTNANAAGANDIVGRLGKTPQTKGV